MLSIEKPGGVRLWNNECLRDISFHQQRVVLYFFMHCSVLPGLSNHVAADPVHQALLLPIRFIQACCCEPIHLDIAALFQEFILCSVAFVRPVQKLQLPFVRDVAMRLYQLIQSLCLCVPFVNNEFPAALIPCLRAVDIRPI